MVSPSMAAAFIPRALFLAPFADEPRRWRWRRPLTGRRRAVSFGFAFFRHLASFPRPSGARQPPRWLVGGSIAKPPSSSVFFSFGLEKVSREDTMHGAGVGTLFFWAQMHCEGFYMREDKIKRVFRSSLNFVAFNAKKSLAGNKKKCIGVLGA